MELYSVISDSYVWFLAKTSRVSETQKQKYMVMEQLSCDLPIRSGVLYLNFPGR